MAEVWYHQSKGSSKEFMWRKAHEALLGVTVGEVFEAFADGSKMFKPLKQQQIGNCMELSKSGVKVQINLEEWDDDPQLMFHFDWG